MAGEEKTTVLITGGSGMIGKYLTSALLSAGYNVSHLSRDRRQYGNIPVFSWDPAKGILDPASLKGIGHIIHLAGAGIGKKRWTRKRKEQILRSRTDAIRLLHRIISENRIKIQTFISASGVSYYGTVTTEKIFTENDPPAGDFLGNVCREWEEAADLFAKDGIRTVKIRTAVVLDRDNIAVRRMLMPVKLGFLGLAGSGKQYMPWIHPEDLISIYIKALDDRRMSGVYNAASPHHVKHKEFMKMLSGVIKKPLLPIPAPAPVLKTVYGEMADLILKGSRVSPEKIQNTGYRFKFDTLQKALEDVFSRSVKEHR